MWIELLVRNYERTAGPGLLVDRYFLESLWNFFKMPKEGNEALKEGSGVQGGKPLPDRVLDEFGKAAEIQLLHDLAAVGFYGF